nr:glycosyltransferase family 9 protein [Geoanaerobacter pelophilus]
MRRLKTARYCNRFVAYRRRRSGRHEIELNLENLAGLGLPAHYSRTEIAGYFGLTRIPELNPGLKNLLVSDKINIILHPKSRMHGREWPARHYLELARLLPKDRFRIFITGIDSEGEVLRKEIPELFESTDVIDLCGKTTLEQSIAFIAYSDGLIASGTGPLHIAAAMGKHALGIFPPRDEIDPAHWGPIGIKGQFICLKERCKPGGSRCPDGNIVGSCACTEAITPEQVFERVIMWER